MNKILLGVVGAGVLAYAGFSLYGTKDKVKLGTPKIQRSVIQFTVARLTIALPIMNASNLKVTYKGILCDIFLNYNGKSVKVGSIDDPSTTTVIQPRATTDIIVDVEISFLSLALELKNFIKAQGWKKAKTRLKGNVFVESLSIPLDVTIG